MKWNSYFRLMRFHKPVGILLLWFPTAWALWIANQETPPLKLIILFLSGTILMRAAGCVINDIIDRNIDIHVKRTQMRPLASGEVSLIEAGFLLCGLLFLSLMLLLFLPVACFYYALIAVLITTIYPFCKRYIEGPQLVLGLAFSMGIPMAFAASKLFNQSTIYLLAINFFWILSYDTQYAMVDRDDDLRIGVKSTAVFFASYDRLMIGFFQLLAHVLWLPLAFESGFAKPFFIGWLLAIFVLIYQQKLIQTRGREHCLQAFVSNSWYGLIMWVAIVLSV